MIPKYKVVFLIPLHKKDDRVLKALTSVPTSGGFLPCIITTRAISKWLTDKHNVKSDYVHIITSKDTSYPALVNRGIEEFKDRAEYISILEYDDTLNVATEEIIQDYILDYVPEDPERPAKVFAPLAFVVKETDGDQPDSLIAISNETPLAPGIAEEDGYYDFNMMLRSNFLFLNGCFFNTEIFDEIGMLKENFEAFYDYEFALRMLYNGIIIKTVPKITHLHLLNDEGAFAEVKEMPKEKREAWLGAARREYFFIEDRELDLE